jgi:hypothetical protein
MSDGVVGDTETALVMRLMEPHVDPSAVLLVPCLVGISGALLQEGVADLPIDMLLLEDVLICEVPRSAREGSAVSRRCAAVCASGDLEPTQGGASKHNPAIPVEITTI